MPGFYEENPAFLDPPTASDSRPHMGRHLLYCLGFTFLLGISSALAEEAPAGGEDSAARAVLDRAQKLDDNERAWRDRTRTMKIVIHDRRGGQRVRDLSMRTLRGEASDDKILAVFETPPDIRGTAFLQFQHRDADADQWLYLPALRRVRRITSSVKDESFMGTDFSYRDMELLTDVIEWRASEARATLLPGSPSSYRISLEPLGRDIGYERIVITLTSEDLVLRGMDFYRPEDEDGKPSKRLALEEVRTVGRVPTAHRMVMRRPAEETFTEVEISGVVYDQDLPADLFTKRSLERGPDLP